MERRCLLHCSFQMRCWARDPAKGGAWMSEAVLRPDRATPYRHSADEVLTALGTDAQSGLRRAEAPARFARVGRNLLDAETPVSTWRRILPTLTGVLVTPLIVATAIPPGPWRYDRTTA